MRVTFAIPAYLPARGYGGPLTNVARLAPALAARGIKVSVVTSTLAAAGVPRLAPGWAEVGGIPVHRLATPAALRWSPWVRPSGLLDPVPDLVHILGAWNGLSYGALNAARRTGIPALWEPAGMLAAAGRHRWLKRMLTPLHARWARQAAGLIWTSRREQAEAPAVVAAGRGWLRPNPPAPPGSFPDRTPTAARSELGLTGPGPLWGFLGRIDPRKGIEGMLRAWSRADGPGRLVLAGPVVDHALARRIDSWGDGVRRLGPLDGKDRWRFLQALDALVLVPPFGENFGNVVMEAVQAGTPALVGAAVGAAEWLGGRGVTVAGEAALVAAFQAGHTPPRPAGLPPELSLDGVADRQLAIYHEACAGGA